MWTERRGNAECSAHLITSAAGLYLQSTQFKYAYREVVRGKMFEQRWILSSSEVRNLEIFSYIQYKFGFLKSVFHPIVKI